MLGLVAVLDYLMGKYFWVERPFFQPGLAYRGKEGLDALSIEQYLTFLAPELEGLFRQYRQRALRDAAEYLEGHHRKEYHAIDALFAECPIHERDDFVVGIFMMQAELEVEEIIEGVANRIDLASRTFLDGLASKMRQLEKESYGDREALENNALAALLIDNLEDGLREGLKRNDVDRLLDLIVSQVWDDNPGKKKASLEWTDNAEQNHEMLRLGYLSGQFPDPEIDGPAVGKAFRPFSELCPAEHAVDTMRATCLSQFSRILKNDTEALHFLSADMTSMFQARGINLE